MNVMGDTRHRHARGTPGDERTWNSTCDGSLVQTRIRRCSRVWFSRPIDINERGWGRDGCGRRRRRRGCGWSGVGRWRYRDQDTSRVFSSCFVSSYSVFLSSLSLCGNPSSLIALCSSAAIASNVRHAIRGFEIPPWRISMPKRADTINSRKVQKSHTNIMQVYKTRLFGLT